MYCICFSVIAHGDIAIISSVLPLKSVRFPCLKWQDDRNQTASRGPITCNMTNQPMVLQAQKVPSQFCCVLSERNRCFLLKLDLLYSTESLVFVNYFNNREKGKTLAKTWHFLSGPYKGLHAVVSLFK